MKMFVTITFEYEADPQHYPVRSPEKMAAIDQESYSDPLNLCDALSGVEYFVTVEAKP